MMTPELQLLIEKLTALAQSGLAYSENVYDIDRYHKLRALTQQLQGALSASDTEQQQAVRLYAGWYPEEEGYRTPKIDVRAIVFRGDSVLLVHEKSDNRWSVPGGWADIGESPVECAIKEVKEESGYQARVLRLLALLDRAKHGHSHFPWYAYKAFYLCEVEGEPADNSMETQGVGFFPLSNLPELSVGRVTQAQLERFFTMVERDQQAAWID